MTSRKLVTIRKIDKIMPIPGADRIELATVDGWQVIIKKGCFRAGDPAVYFEIDSMLPDVPLYAFLGPCIRTAGGLGHRLKTIKMRGVLSQGLLLKIEDVFGDTPNSFDNLDKLSGVWLYEPVDGDKPSNDSTSGRWPSFLPKTSQPRIQNLPGYFSNYKHELFEATLKLDGSSLTVWNYSNSMIKKRPASGPFLPLRKWIAKKIGSMVTFGVCSKNLNLRRSSSNKFWAAVNKSGIEPLLKNHNVALQFELVGPRIQGNHEKVHENDIYLYNIYDIDKKRNMTPSERRMFIEDVGLIGKIKQVPTFDGSVTGSIAIFSVCKNISEMQQFIGKKGMNPGVTLEGLVFKSVDSPSVSFKCISNEYLLGLKNGNGK